jgi:hypothetical protein
MLGGPPPRAGLDRPQTMCDLPLMTTRRSHFRRARAAPNYAPGLRGRVFASRTSTAQYAPRKMSVMSHAVSHPAPLLRQDRRGKIHAGRAACPGGAHGSRLRGCLAERALRRSDDRRWRTMCAAPRSFAVAWGRTSWLLNAGVSVVLDFPANTAEQRDWMRGILNATGAAHRLHLAGAARCGLPGAAACAQRRRFTSLRGDGGPVSQGHAPFRAARAQKKASRW